MSGVLDAMALGVPLISGKDKRFTTLGEEDLKPYVGHDMNKRTLDLLANHAFHRDGYAFVEAITASALNEGSVIQRVDTKDNVRGSNFYKVISDRTFIGGGETCGDLEGCHVAAPPTSIDYVDEEDLVCRFGWIHKDDIRAWFDPNDI